jgi:MFS family permease
MYGDWLTTVAIVVLVVRATGSSAAPAGYMLARVLPRILGAGPGGSLADRHGGARVVAVFAVMQGILTASIIPAGHAGAAWAIFAAVALGQLCQGASRSAMGTIIPSVAGSARIGRANALYNIGQASAIVIAPALAAPLLVLRGPDLLLGIDVVTFAVAAALMLSLPRSQQEERPRTEKVTAGPATGLRVIRRDPTLRMLAIAYVASALTATVAGSVLVLAAGDRFGGEHLVGCLYAAVGAGDILGGVVTLRRSPPRSMRRALVALSVVAVLGIATLTVTTALWMAVVVLAVSGVAETSYVSWGATVMQKSVDGEVLGRVNSVIVLAQSSGMVAGALLALFLVPLLGWAQALLVACFVGVALLGLGTLTSRTAQQTQRVGEPV